MYERLTRRMSDGTAVFAEKSKSFYSAQIYEEAREKNRQILERLCDLEDKIEQGKILELPCAVGDIVYAPHCCWTTIDRTIVPYQITNITITQNKKGEWTKKYRAMEVKNGKTIDWQLNFAFDEIGKTVFLAPEEAHNKLKELENEQR